MFDSTVCYPRPGRGEQDPTARLVQARERLMAEPEPVTDPATAAQSMQSVVDAVSLMRAVDLTGLSDEDVSRAVVKLEHTRRSVDGLFASGLARLEASGGVESMVGLAVPGWLAERTNGGSRQTKRMLRAGRTLTRFGDFAAAVDGGDLTIEHVVVLGDASNERIADQLLQAEATLLELALSCTVEQFRRALRHVVARLDTDGPVPDCCDRDQVAMTTDATGTLHLSGSFSGHNAASIRHIIEEEMNRQLRAASADRDAGVGMPSAATLRARAFAQIFRTAGAGDQTSSRAPRTEAVVVIREQDLSDVHGEPLNAVTAAVLACDALTHPIVIDEHGMPLFHGRGSRYATPVQRRALIVRDGGCSFPGCEAPASWCDAHHVIPWERGGRTDIDNLVLLCRRHHGLAHHAHWDLSVRTDDGVTVFLWTNPAGRELPARRRPAA